MADSIIRFSDGKGVPVMVKAVDNNDGTYSMATSGSTVASGTVTANQGTAGAAAWPTKDAGPSQTVTRTYTYAADGSTAFDITTAPAAGLKAVAMDIIVSVDTACQVSIQMETTNNVLASAFLPANSGFQQITPRGYIKGDAAAKKLMAKTSVASKICVTVVWYTEA